MKKNQIDSIAVTAIQHVLDASKVQVFTAGRQDLAARASLQFVAEQADAASRTGFELAETEKYSLPGGLDAGELEGLFRTTAGLKAEFVLRQSARAWALDGVAPVAGAVPPVLAKEMGRPLSVAGLQRICDALHVGMARTFGETSPRRAPTPVTPQSPAGAGIKRV